MHLKIFAKQNEKLECEDCTTVKSNLSSGDWNTKHPLALTKKGVHPWLNRRLWTTQESRRWKSAGLETHTEEKLAEARVVDSSHARIEPRPQSQATDCFRGKSVCKMKCAAWLLFALFPRFFAVLPVTNSQIVGQRTPARQGLGREQPIVKIPDQGSVAGKEVRRFYFHYTLTFKSLGTKSWNIFISKRRQLNRQYFI